MFALAIILGIYSYSIFFLGLLGLLTRAYIFIDTAAFILLTLFLFRNTSVREKLITFFASLKNDRLSMLFVILLLSQIVINVIGAFGPELAFDALWYHLTLPKIYATSKTIYFIPGSLLYYSGMPQLTEMYYLVALILQNEIVAKLIHFLFGILICVAIYIFSKQILLKKQTSLLAVLIFYANLVVGWESITAFSDLSRTFFELLAFWAFITWSNKNNTKWLIITAVLLGFAIATKLLALGSIGIFLILIMYVAYTKHKSALVYYSSKNSFLLAGLALLVVSPWLLYTYTNTGNPIYPFFSKLHLIQLSGDTANPLLAIGEIWKLFVSADDPILPIYLILLPLIYFLRKKIGISIRLLFIYSALSLLYWYLLPKIGGGRFILPYLPVYSILAAFLIGSLKSGLLKRFLVVMVIILATTSILYRGIANIKYFHVLVGVESKNQFLTKRLNYAFGDFYDTDDYFKNTIMPGDMVLLYGFHNLYYVNFPFIDESFAKGGDKFNYIAVQHGELPKKYTDAVQVYKNPITDVRLYKLKRFMFYE